MSLADIAMGKLPAPQQQPQPMPNALAQAAMPQQQAPQLPPQGMPQTPPPMQPPAQPQPMPMQPMQQQSPQSQPSSIVPTGGQFNGKVTYNGQTSYAKNGVISEAGKQFFVSNDGSKVWDTQNTIIGSIDNKGNFIPDSTGQKMTGGNS